jgi:hypothetical protein
MYNCFRLPVIGYVYFFGIGGNEQTDEETSVTAL